MTSSDSFLNIQGVLELIRKYCLSHPPLTSPAEGNVIELRERAFLFEVKLEGLTEYSPGRQPWDKDLIIFLALKGLYIILSRAGKLRCRTHRKVGEIMSWKFGTNEFLKNLIGDLE
ncbi:MAG: hypothetical protein A3F91_08340 [Flavobacteria bacterium RIFCSPLOWO2_12_FULL_35_11]|nr:MAG: hypothetical protein A3F91_08340 [Flavobacteria bacterium RIFCSPLOWO2_12_FULL_35_11]